MPFRHPLAGYTPAASSAEAMALTQVHGLPEAISFDHDLGGEDNAMVYCRWMAETYYDSKVPEYAVHSANPVGKLNIESFMNSWKKSQSL
jgi:hypothetical protein